MHTMVTLSIHGFQFFYPIELIIAIGVGQSVDPAIHLFHIIINRDIKAIKRPEKSIGCPDLCWYFFNVIFQ